MESVLQARRAGKQVCVSNCVVSEMKQRRDVLVTGWSWDEVGRDENCSDWIPFTLFSIFAWRGKEVQWLFDENGSVMGLKEGSDKPGFTHSTRVFIVEVMGMFCYFSDFNDIWEMVGLDIGCGLYLVKFDAV